MLKFWKLLLPFEISSKLVIDADDDSKTYQLTNYADSIPERKTELKRLQQKK